MKRVKIIKNWKNPDLLCQTPECKGLWGNVQFTLDPDASCDYLVVLNYIPDKFSSLEIPEKTWAIIQEPYVPGIFDWVVQGHESFQRVFTHHIFNDNPKYFATQTCLPWHVNKSYDELVSIGIPRKTRGMSWITSSKQVFPGHKKRMRYYENLMLQKEFDLDVFGHGIQPIEDKWDGLAPYKYSLAIENSSSKHYWTEKLADCFLAYTLPIYHGCTNLGDYFPEKSFIQIDIDDFENSIEAIKKVIEENPWEERIEAIIEARELVLKRYQLFPFLENQINQEKQ